MLNVKSDKKRYREGEKANIHIHLKNTSNFDWYVHGMSHRIAIGIKVLDSNGNIVDPAFGEILIPKNLKKSDCSLIQMHLKQERITI